jgi:hypothetical protein
MKITCQRNRVPALVALPADVLAAGLPASVADLEPDLLPLVVADLAAGLPASVADLEPDLLPLVVADLGALQGLHQSATLGDLNQPHLMR